MVVGLFLTALEARGEGIAGGDARARAEFASERRAMLEAYPVDKSARGRDDSMWFGAKAMYDRAGFKEIARRKPQRPVVRKALRAGRS